MPEVSTKQQHIISFLTNYFAKSIICPSENPALTAMWTLYNQLCYECYFYFILTWFFNWRLKVGTETLQYTQLI